LQLLDGEHGGWNAADTACFEDGRRQSVILRTSHGRLNQAERVGVKK
jgi:hypothetical protein